ncbi:MAG: NAD(P)/FAD-dependent oxidoreductase [Vicinamibacterales bacterium]
MIDVLIVGAGPAGSVAAIHLARAGVRVRLVDRTRFPRPKLCGDSINPGAASLLLGLGLRLQDTGALRIPGMRLTGLDVPLRPVGGSGARPTDIEAMYPGRLQGWTLSRSRLDAWLLERAIADGAAFEPDVMVTGPLTSSTRGGNAVRGVRGITRRGPVDFEARVVLAADGRRSRLAFALGLARPSLRPRRWAVGAILAGVPPFATGEMHVRANGYIGLAPLPDGLTNACVVTADVQGALREPAAFLKAVLQADPLLRDRMARLEMALPAHVLGPLATEPTGAETAGVLCAGDAAGFIDPITGDGLRFAVEGAEIAAAAAVRALSLGWEAVHPFVRRERRERFAAKWRMNLAVRRLVASPAALRAAACTGRWMPGLIRALITRAGDVGLADRVRDVRSPVLVTPWSGSQV